jgi:hypothetical protein
VQPGVQLAVVAPVALQPALALSELIVCSSVRFCLSFISMRAQSSREKKKKSPASQYNNKDLESPHIVSFYTFFVISFVDHDY